MPYFLPLFYLWEGVCPFCPRWWWWLQRWRWWWLWWRRRRGGGRVALDRRAKDKSPPCRWKVTTLHLPPHPRKNIFSFYITRACVWQHWQSVQEGCIIHFRWWWKTKPRGEEWENFSSPRKTSSSPQKISTFKRRCWWCIMYDSAVLKNMFHYSYPCQSVTRL